MFPAFPILLHENPAACRYPEESLCSWHSSGYFFLHILIQPSQNQLPSQMLLTACQPQYPYHLFRSSRLSRCCLLLPVNHNMPWLACNHNRRQLRLNQRPDVIYKFRAYIRPVFGNPLQRHLFFDICNLMHVV